MAVDEISTEEGYWLRKNAESGDVELMQHDESFGAVHAITMLQYYTSVLGRPVDGE